ncbi:MAG TPA: Ig-like domain-containing protein [Gemmatimonadaceae bacterium]|nr:Ig-like domain-containing protein [Gemmatimonadaceae bacterium]
MTRLGVGLLVSGAVALAGCSKESRTSTTPPPPPPPVTYSVAITAPDSTLMVGQTSQLSATVTRDDRQPVGVVTIVWTSSDSTIATLNATGLLSARAAGSVTVTAAANGASAKTGIRVRPSPRDNAAKIIAESVYVGQTIDLRAYLLDNGTSAFLDSTTWTSSDPTVGTVVGGVFTGLKRGVSTVTATRGTKVGVVDVLAQTRVKGFALAPDTLEMPVLSSSAFDAIATDSAGKPIYGRSVTWSIADTSKLKVSGGVLTAKAGGTTTVTAVCEGAVAMAVVRITAPSAWTIALSATQTWVGVGKTLPITSDVRDASNVLLPGATLNWSSSDSTIARVSATGIVTGVARGKATIAGETLGRRGTFAVSVEEPVASIVFAPDTLFLPTHGTLPLLASLRDAGGNSLTTRPIAWTSSDTNIVNLTINPNFAGGFQASARATAGQATISAASDGVVGTLKAIVSSGTDQMHFDYPSANAATYVMFDMHVSLLDVTGTAISGRGVRIVSSDPGILSVQPDTGATANGALTLHLTTGHSGDATITATSGTLSTNFMVHVVSVPVRVKIAFKPGTLPVGKTYRLTASALLPSGAQYFVDWSTSDASVASVSDSGLVTPLSGGFVRIIARGHDPQFPAADTATIAIGSPQSPVVTAVSPPQLQAGGSATITGQNFSTTPGANVVTVDGLPAQVTAATATQLNITIPSPASFPCQATHAASLIVSTGPGLVAISQPILATAPQDTLAVGDADLWSPADSRCNELAHDTGLGLYLLTISNGGTSASSTTGFSFAVDTGFWAPTTVAASAARLAQPVLSRSVAPPIPRGATASGVLRISRDSLRRAAIAHRNLLEKSRKLAATLGSPLPALRRAARLRASADVVAAASSAPDIGTNMFIRVPRIDTPEFCDDYRTIEARVVYSGAHSIILEDVQAPVAGFMDDYYQSVGAEFDQTTYDIIAKNFGDPMAMDASLGGPGRVTMLFTPAVNEMGPTGFVVSCDFYPATSVPSSNQREMFYAVVPTTSGFGFDGSFTRDVWRHIIRGTIAHETKHIASMAEHFARQAPQQEESWLEEGTAMHAMELWARTVTPMKWKGGSGYSTAPYCDVRPTWAACVSQPYTMYDHFLYLHDFLTPSEQHTPLGSTDPYDASFYGSVWWLVRWAVDQYATDEGAFLRALTQEPSLTGVANLSARTGRPWGELVRDWSLATLTSYDAPALSPRDARLTTPSWRLRDVFDGIARDFPDLVGPGMLTPHINGCAMTPTVIHAMPPGGISFYYVGSCYSWKNFFRFQSDNGGSPSSALSIALIRIQ